MPKPATFTPAEISALADRLREVWRPGSQITPWLRDNAEKLTKLNREERFSWAAVAAALNEVGIVYRTGNPWTASNLAKAVSAFRPGGRGNPTTEQKAAIAAAMVEWTNAPLVLLGRAFRSRRTCVKEVAEPKPLIRQGNSAPATAVRVRATYLLPETNNSGRTGKQPWTET
jgi:hypothetical protein